MPNPIDLDRVDARDGAVITDLSAYRDAAANAARTSANTSKMRAVLIVAALVFLLFFLRAQ